MTSPSPCIAARQLDDEPLHVASLVVHTRPSSLESVRSWLLEQEGVEVHAESAQGKLVVVMETIDQQAILDLIDQAVTQPGCINAALVYHEIVTEES
jgi:periplasmic nitrate reductase NapD